MSFDGDGQQIKTVETYYDEEFNEQSETKYYIRSTVLGGQVLAEVNQVTSEFRRFVYAGPTVLAWIYSYPGFESVTWDQRDPSGATIRSIGQQELDPLGADAGPFPNAVQPSDGPLMSYGRSYSPANPSITYSVNGIRVSADDFMNFAGMELQQPLLILKGFVQRSAKAIGRRNTGISWGRRFEVIYDVNGKVVNVHWGKYDSNLRAVSFGKLSLIYSNESLPDLSLFKRNPEFDMVGIPEMVKDILSKSACIEFAKRILNAVATEDNPLFNGGDLQALFDKFFGQKKGIYTRKMPPGSAGYGSPSGLISEGDGRIFSSEYGSWFSPEQKEVDVSRTVSELFHLAGQNDHYPDRALAEAVYRIPEYAAKSQLFTPTVFDPGYEDKEGAKANPNHIGWSNYFHDIQRQYCKP